MINTNFEILDPLGTGGTAEVFRVLDRDRREMALKVPLDSQLSPDIDFQLLARREHYLIGEHRFPGLVRIREFSDDPPYLLLELCRGPSLDQLTLPVSEQLALNIASAIAVDLEYLRRSTVVHGDLKPQNIFLPRQWHALEKGALLYAKISDFSLGRTADESEDKRAGLGTVGFMAPETVLENRTSHASDLFALGVTLYQLACGKHPFLLENDHDPIRTNGRVCEGHFAKPEELAAEINEGLAALIKSLLMVSPADRPGTAWDVCLQLEEIGSSYPYVKALRPEHFIDPRSICEIQGRELFGDSPHCERLLALAENDSCQLHQLVRFNAAIGRIEYHSEGIKIKDAIVWPNRMRNSILSEFACGSFGQRRKAIWNAIAGSAQAYGRIVSPNENPSGASDSTSELLLPLLKPSTVRRLSSSLGDRAKTAEQWDLAATLYVQSGDLEQAASCVEMAVEDLESKHQSNKALQLLDKVLELGSLRDKQFEIRRLQIMKGGILKGAGRIEDSLEAYIRLTELYDDQPHDSTLAETYKKLGDVYKMRQDAGGALGALGKALEIYDELGDELEISHTLNNMGNAHWLAGDLREALRNYRAALRIQRRLDATWDIASTLSNIGSVYGIQGRLRRSLDIMGISLEMKRELGDLGEIARTLNNMGYVHHLRGDTGRAIECLTESLELNRRIGSQQEVLFNLENLSSLSIQAGHLTSALSLLAEGVDLAKELGDTGHASAFACQSGTVMKRMGRFDEAKAQLDVAEDLGSEVDDLHLDFQVRLARAGWLAAVGDINNALEEAKQIAHEAQEKEDKTNLLEATLLITRLCREEQWFEVGIELATELEMHRESMLLEFNRMSRLADTEPHIAREQLESGLRDKLNSFHEDLERPGLLNSIAEMEITNYRVDEAVNLLENGLRLATQNGLPPEQALIMTNLGRVAFDRGEFESAFKRFRQALELHKSMASSIADPVYQKIYQNQPSVQLLVKKIRALGAKLAKK